MPTHISEEIARSLELRGLSQARAADRIKMDRSLFSRIVRGVYRPGEQVLLRLAINLRLDPEERQRWTAARLRDRGVQPGECTCPVCLELRRMHRFWTRDWPTHENRCYHQSCTPVKPLTASGAAGTRAA